VTVPPEAVAAAQAYDVAHRYDDPRASRQWSRVSDAQAARLLAGAQPLLAAAERERIRQQRQATCPQVVPPNLICITCLKPLCRSCGACECPANSESLCAGLTGGDRP